MADYIEISDTQLDPDAPITSQLMYQLRDNLLAVLEGSETAPRFSFDALGVLKAGNSLRVSGIETSSTGASTYGTSVSHGFLQNGTVRCLVYYVSGQVDTRRIRRVRAGVTTTLFSAGGTGLLSADVDVKHGDVILLEGSGGATTASGTSRGEIRIDSGNLWVGSGGNVTGNPD